MACVGLASRQAFPVRWFLTCVDDPTLRSQAAGVSYRALPTSAGRNPHPSFSRVIEVEVDSELDHQSTVVVDSVRCHPSSRISTEALGY